MRTCNVTFDFLWTFWWQISAAVRVFYGITWEKELLSLCERLMFKHNYLFFKKKKKKRKRGSVDKFLLQSLSKEVLSLSLSTQFLHTAFTHCCAHRKHTHGRWCCKFSLFFLNTLVLTCFGNHSWDNCIGLMLISNRRVQYALTVRRKIRKLYVSNRHGRADRCLWQPVPALWPISRYLEHRCY